MSPYRNMSNQDLQMSCDVAIIGGGLAGLVAGVRAAQDGRKVLIFEKSNEELYVCNSRLTGGVFRLALKDIQSPPEVLEQAILDGGGDAVDSALARAVARDAMRAVRWLQSLGARF